MTTMLDLAQHENEDNVTESECISIKAIAERHEISVKYLEAIVAMLNKGGLVRSTRGKGGGYRLARPASGITVAEIMAMTEGSLAPVDCLDSCPAGCEYAESCLTLPMWRKLDSIVADYLSSVTLEDLIQHRISDKA